ncbi:carcinoembryonic antigen-related cell adhesion molecule 20-like [Hemibagrus wyckioides]|uniref:carcinoembryonic antigen-related cell adhesion molecule 20-like n=1 Tax=Hemibagrus wyckioides TaxID=337641 RepID=UPI00266BA139|nr:carcinoembryonic antigen-related cell adhesion molecule 20-like [Hemibagrus wyckioides]
MEQVMMVILFITLLKGFNQEQILLPPSPINKEVGGSVLFTTMPFSQPIKAIRWNFNSSDFITYSDPGPAVVDTQYQGRVVLNYTTAELELISLTMADSGKYTLTVTFTNGIGIANHTFLEVYEPVLSFGIVGPEGYLIEHKSANFTCQGNGTISTIMWKKDNEILDASSSITFSDDNRTMVINPLMRSDTGDYQCILSNPISSSPAYYGILVNYGPDVRILGVQTIEEGSDILLLCFPDSEPIPIVRWTVNGVPSTNPSLYVTENSNPGDSGDYNCTCSNPVTGITASAVHYIAVRPVSSRLAPGVEAGITLGILALVILSVAIYFLVKHFRKQAKPERDRTVPMVSNQQTNQTAGHINVAAQVDTADQNARPSHPIYQNRQPTPPPRGRLPKLPDKQTDDTMYCTAIG